MTVTERGGDGREDARRRQLDRGDDARLGGATLPVGEHDHRYPGRPLRAVEQRECGLDAPEVRIPRHNPKDPDAPRPGTTARGGRR